MYIKLVVLLPLLDLGLCQTQDVLGGVGRSFAATDVQEVQTLGSLVQVLLVAVGVAQVAEGVGLDQSSGLGIVQLLANGLLHESQTSFPEWVFTYGPIIHISVRKSSAKTVKMEHFSKNWTMDKLKNCINGFLL